MKKLLIFGPANSPHLLSWSIPFIEKFQVEIVSFHAPSPTLDYSALKGIKIHSLKSITGTKFDYLLHISKVQAIVNTFQPDIIHAHYASSYGLICSLLKGQFLKVLTVWGSDINYARKNFIHRKFIDSALLKFDWVNVPSNDLQKTLRSIGVKEDKIIVFQYGTDLDLCLKFKTPKSERSEVVVLSSRQWSPLYNIDKVVEGFRLAYERNPALRLILIGSGSEDDTSRIQELVADHQAIKVLGFLTKESLIKQLWSSDIFISIPDTDGMSLSVLEALFCENYPLLSKIPPNEEILENGEGHLIDNFIKESVAEKLLEASECFKKADLSKNIAFIDSRANYKKNMMKMEIIYNGRKGFK